MGNTSSSNMINWDQLLFLRCINEQLRIMQDKKTQLLYLSFDQHFYDTTAYEKSLEKASEFQQIKLPQFLNLVNYRGQKEGSWCTVNNKAQLLFEYFEKTLGDYNLSFQNAGKSYTESDLWYIIQQALKAISFYEHHIHNTYKNGIHANNTYITPYGQVKFNDCQFYNNEYQDLYLNQQSSLNPYQSQLDQFQLDLINVGLMICEAGNLSCRATSKLIITNNKLRTEILSLKQNYSENLGEFVESLINVGPKEHARFFLQNLNVLQEQRKIMIGERIDLTGNHELTNEKKKQEKYPYTQQFETQKVNDLQFHHQFRVNKREFNNVLKDIPQSQVQKNNVNPYDTFEPQVFKNQFRDDNFLNEIDNIIQNSKQITTNKTEYNRDYKDFSQEKKFNYQISNLSNPKDRIPEKNEYNYRQKKESIDHTPEIKITQPIKIEKPVSGILKSINFDKYLEKPQPQSLIVEKPRPMFEPPRSIERPAYDRTYEDPLLQKADEALKRSKNQSFKTSSQLQHQRQSSTSSMNRGQPSNEKNQMESFKHSRTQVEQREPQFLKSEIREPQFISQIETHQRSDSFYGKKDPSTLKLLERADQVLSNSTQIMNQLKNTRQEPTHKRDYESKIDRMLSQSPKRKPIDVV